MQRVAVRLLCAVALTSSIFVAAPGRAVDGVLEINDASVVGAGGYPFIIGASASYVLTGSLTPPPGASGIVVGAPNVEIDLNGFSITTPGGAGSVGIDAPGLDGLSVHDGTISGFATGIAAGADARILRTHLTGNATGIGGASLCLIIENTVSGNTSIGIQAVSCKIENNVVRDNALGIAGENNLIIHNQIMGNTAGGILLLPAGGNIVDNVISLNAFGISDLLVAPAPVPPPIGMPRATSIIGNTISMTTGGPGISVYFPALITDNSITGAAADGIVCGAACSVRGNSVESNNIGGIGTGGIVVADGSNVTGNSIGFNVGPGLSLPVTAGYSQNTFMLNAPDVLTVPPGPHPTSGFMNLCTGLVGPAPTCP